MTIIICKCWTRNITIFVEGNWKKKNMVTNEILAGIRSKRQNITLSLLKAIGQHHSSCCVSQENIIPLVALVRRTLFLLLRQLGFCCGSQENIIPFVAVVRTTLFLLLRQLGQHYSFCCGSQDNIIPFVAVVRTTLFLGLQWLTMVSWQQGVTTMLLLTFH